MKLKDIVDERELKDIVNERTGEVIAITKVETFNDWMDFCQEYFEKKGYNLVITATTGNAIWVDILECGVDEYHLVTKDNHLSIL